MSESFIHPTTEVPDGGWLHSAYMESLHQHLAAAYPSFDGLLFNIEGLAAMFDGDVPDDLDTTVAAWTEPPTEYLPPWASQVSAAAGAAVAAVLPRVAPSLDAKAIAQAEQMAAAAALESMAQPGAQALDDARRAAGKNK